MPTRLQVCTWIAALGLLSPSVATGQERTEREIVELIVRDGPQARAIRAQAEVTRREQSARLAYPNPLVSYSREGAGFTDFLQAEQSLPIFGPRAALARAGGSAAAAAEAERDVRLWQLRSDGAIAVARLAAGQARLAAAQSLERRIERLIEILRAREREGEGSRFDRMRAEQELRDTQQVVADASAGIVEARAVLAGMLPTGTSVDRIARPSNVLPSLTVGRDALLSSATTSRADLRVLQQSGQRASFEADAARDARRPSPTVFGGMKRADGVRGRETGGVIGLSASIPLFDSGDREAARWSAEALRIEAERSAIEQRIREEVAGAFEALALRQAALARDQPGAAEELVQIAEVAYREGEVGILELLDSVRTAARAHMRAIELQLDTRLAQVALERAVGETLWP